MSIEFIFRIIGMFVLAILGLYTGVYLAGATDTQYSRELYALVSGLVGALIGLILTPFVTTRPVRSLRSILARVSAQTLISGLIGLVVGLIIAALLAFPLSLLPSPFGKILPFIGVLLFCYFGVAVFVMRQVRSLYIHPFRVRSREHRGHSTLSSAEPDHSTRYKRYYRWSDCRYRPDWLPGRHFVDTALCA